MSTPAERYAHARQQAKAARTELAAFTAGIGFELDEFQEQACIALEAGRSVLVAAPTGAGKTVVAEFGVHLAVSQGKKAFYTTPIKALSNQKYAELVSVYGEESVGLLTGDLTINGEAQIVVMTTEVLRNMLYADSAALDGLGYVVMDEVHYLADRFRGPVWEEVIIHLPAPVRLISLSATVSNAEEFGAWLAEVRGRTDVIVSEHRPVPLWQHIMAGTSLYDLFESDDSTRVNPELLKLAEQESRRSRLGQPGHRRNRNRRNDSRRGTSPAEGVVPKASRIAVLKRLDAEGLLPAITFIFSRAGCDAAVHQCLSAKLSLTTPQERATIRSIVEERCADLSSEDLDVLGYASFRDGLIHGFAAHHAGMLPTFKELVEQLFLAGYVRAVFATETLALGINMPARTVVLEKLVKFNGETHSEITAGEYTQLTGRAGRRGIDVEGHAVVLWAPGIDPSGVGGLASRRTYELKSSFRPTYNMSANLVTQVGREEARKVLETSFAQFQADKGVVGIARQVRQREEALAGYAASMECHLGDFSEYFELRRELGAAEKRAASGTSRLRRRAIEESMLALALGDVIEVSGGRRAAIGVVIHPGRVGKSSVQLPTILTVDRHMRVLRESDIAEPVEALMRIKVPKRFDARSPKSRRDLSSSLRNAVNEGGLPPAAGDSRMTKPQRTAAEDARIDDLRKALRANPCHGCPDRETHARFAERWWNLRKDTDGLVRQIRGRTNSIARVFDRVCEVLEKLGYLPDNTSVLRRIYGEKDLLTAQSLKAGIWEGLDAPEIAALASTLVFSARREETGIIERLPSARLSTSLDSLVKVWSELDDIEAQHKLPRTAEPDFGLVWPMFKWANGRNLDAVLRGTDLAAGDFVRWAKQVLDLLDQVAKVSDGETQPRVRTAIEKVRRGVVGYSAV
ncbi:DEAD/DEAH box helicase [Saxibacter everestensis]|uniref:DEAD/DEAH box helicase n=1 Tax=Saxibacter everestensis TaxID=2909229 RepID=A0ABY8QX67_9MICO|nr:DEAD/DEAH box helicase [Brevibacteriaceae bacterium ZFBP1038]